MIAVRSHLPLAALCTCLGLIGCSSAEPNRQALTPTGGTANAGGDAPSTGGTGDTTGGTNAVTGGTMAPTGGTMAPTGGTMAPTGGTMAPTGGTMAPTGGTMAPTGGTMAPTGGTMATGGSSGSGGGGPINGTYFTTSFEAQSAGQNCRNEHSSFTAETSASCDATERATDGQQSASTHQPSGQTMIVVHGGFSVSQGEVWLSYDMFAESRPTFTIMMDPWRRGMNGSDPNNPWSNRNPFSIEWRDGWFAMNCNYPDDHGTERRSEQVSLSMGVGSWVNVVAQYDFASRRGAFWVRRVDDQGRPMGNLDSMSPTGRVNCAGLGDRGAVEGLAFTDFQHQGAVRVWTDRWILSDQMSDMP